MDRHGHDLRVNVSDWQNGILSKSRQYCRENLVKLPQLHRYIFVFAHHICNFLLLINDRVLTSMCVSMSCCCSCSYVHIALVVGLFYLLT